MKRILIILLILSIFPLFVFAQDSEKPIAVLEYYDDEMEIEIIDPTGYPVDFLEYGMELEIGSTINTSGSTAEIRLDPNGSIVKLSYNTSFKIESLQGQNSDANEFELLAGKLRTIAARSGLGENYSIKTSSAVCGIRGTDLGREFIEGVLDTTFVSLGEAEFTSLLSGETISLTSGMLGNALSDVFEAITLTAEEMADQFKDLSFVQLDEALVPGHAVEPVEETPEQEPVEETPEEPEAVAPPVVLEDPPAEDPPAEEPAAPEVPAAPPGPLEKFLKDILGMEIGTITIGGVTYSKAVLQPTFTIGQLKMALYLPLIYSTNMFDPDDWYKPRGNDEWSFGTDEEHETIMEKVQDALSDIFLKIKFLQFADIRDPFFFKLGNIEDMTVGHGILMNNYSNNTDFPAVRKLGINMGLDLGGFGFEALLNDVTQPDIFGTRLYIRPFAESFPMALGLSAIADINPYAELPSDTTFGDYGKPIFINAAFDIDFPFFETDLFSMVLFADTAAMVPYFQSDVSDTNITMGLKTEAVIADDSIKNFGIAAGLFGNIFMVDWKLEYRYYNGTFKPAFFDSVYDRIRGTYVENIISYLDAPEADTTAYTMGIFGQAGVNILDMVTFELGYMWPWTIDESGAVTTSEDDFLHVEIVVLPDTIPVVPISGSISYDRSKFIPTLLKEGTGAELSLFDKYTVVKGEFSYPVAPMLDIAVIVTTTMVDDVVSPSFGIESRVHF